MKQALLPSRVDFDAMLRERHGPEVQMKLSAGRIAVAGLGGLGSHIALALARAGVGRLLLVDFDRVELSNLGRQAYGWSHLGRPKTEALAELIAEINPYLKLELLDLKLTAENIPQAFQGWPVVIEAFDQPESKAELAGTVLSSLPEAKLISSSGLAGLHNPNLIRSRRLGERWHLCGDEQNAAGAGQSLMAARVMICAGHQATLALLLLAGLDNDL